MKQLSVIFNPGEMAQIDDSINLARRMSDKTGFNFSGTKSAGEISALGSAGVAAAVGHPLPLIALGGKMLANRQIASAMLNPEGRAIITTMAKLPAGSPLLSQYMSKLSAIAAAQEAGPVAQASQ